MLPTVPFMGTPLRHTLQQQQATEAGSEKLLVGTTKKEEDLKAPPGCEGTVLIVPPCEKGSLKEQCDYIGYERAAYLATLFGPGHERYPQPSYLIAESPGDRRDIHRKNVREMETITPLADKFGLDIDTRFSTLDMNDFQSYVHKLFQNGDMCGKLMVISWKHVKIPRLANAIGCGPREGCPLDYPNSDQFTDAILQIKLVHRKHSPMEEGYLQVTKNTEWLVFGSMQQQGFDPLSFSKKSGNYPVGGTPYGGRWVANDDKDVY